MAEAVFNTFDPRSVRGPSIADGWAAMRSALSAINPALGPLSSRVEADGYGVEDVYMVLAENRGPGPTLVVRARAANDGPLIRYAADALPFPGW